MNKIDVLKAHEMLLKGEVVAIPTETVYGLGGWIFSEDALKKIFSIKERPSFDPLIVHVDSTKKAKTLTRHWNDTLEFLAHLCWPGPLTLLAPKNELVNPLITSGLDSVGLRCPAHPETLKLLEMIEGGIAAPSANKFGKTSPTSAKHVFEEFNNVVPILDGGECHIGIESTVVAVKENRIEIYRPGHYTASFLKESLENAGINCEVVYGESPVAPGQLKHHYMPKIPLVIVPENFILENALDKIPFVFKKPVFWNQPESPVIAARELYQKMREFDQDGFDIIFVTKDKRSDLEEWRGIWNRLEKAKKLELS